MEVDLKGAAATRLARRRQQVPLSRRLDSLHSPNYPKSLAQKKRPSADVAQLVEHLICNQAVASSTLAVSSVGALVERMHDAGARGE